MNEKELKKCTCPILAGNIIYDAMMLLDDTTYTNPRISINQFKMELSLYLDGFEKNNCVDKNSRLMMPIREMKRRIDKISTEPISNQSKDIQAGIDAANDMALDSVHIKDPIELL